MGDRCFSLALSTRRTFSCLAALGPDILFGFLGSGVRIRWSPPSLHSEATDEVHNSAWRLDSTSCRLRVCTTAFWASFDALWMPAGAGFYGGDLISFVGVLKLFASKACLLLFWEYFELDLEKEEVSRFLSCWKMPYWGLLCSAVLESALVRKLFDLGIRACDSFLTVVNLDAWPPAGCSVFSGNVMFSKSMIISDIADEVADEEFESYSMELGRICARLTSGGESSDATELMGRSTCCLKSFSCCF